MKAWKPSRAAIIGIGTAALIAVVGGAVGAVVATGGHPAAKPPVTHLVRTASTVSPTTTTTAPGPTTTTTAPSVTATTTAGNAGTSGPTTTTSTASTGSTTTTTTVPPATTTTTTPQRQAPTFLGAGTLHGCTEGRAVGVSGGLSGTPHPTGTLSVTGGGMSATVPAVGMGTITCTAPPGTYTMTVTYAGDANWLPGSWTFTLKVTAG